ncbi:MAG: hydrogenase maturation nickel metallochaperone HypA [Candidatus Hodarchaeota archaeon]
MHEFSLASEIANIAVSVGKDNNFQRIKRIDINVGEFSFVNPEQIAFWLKVLSEEDPNYNIIRDSHIEFHKKKGIITCLKCNYQGSTSTTPEGTSMHMLVDAFVTCPECGSHSTTIIKGRDVVVSSIQGN